MRPLGFRLIRDAPGMCHIDQVPQLTPALFILSGFPFGPHLGLDPILPNGLMGGHAGAASAGSAVGPAATNNNSTASSNPDPNIKVTLENEDLWRRFHQIGTEMIITKMGR